MKIQVVWALISLLIVMAMILASCGSEETTTTAEEGSTIISGITEAPVPEREPPKETTHEEKPQYGGIARIALASDITGFDECFLSHPYVTTLKLTNEEMLQGDWTKGPAGTGETDFILSGISDMILKTGSLADTWEIPERGKFIFHIREGVYWHNKPPTNGRALTVEDVVFNFTRMTTHPGSYLKMTYPNMCKTIKITGDNAARTVTLEVPTGEHANVLTLFTDFLSIMPKDAIELYGDLNDWRNSIGTGAFMMTDYVSNGSATFIKNPNYWGTNPIGPGKGDKLPYLEGVKFLIITDTSTRLAAFRTGKIDGTSGEYDDVKEFLENPDVKYMTYTSDSALVIYMHTDRADLPFSKKEVRQALMMATDFKKIRDEYYGGKAVILTWPIAPVKEYKDAYVPIENLPSNVQELYSYNPDKARELLKAAGHPTGFNTTITTYNTPTYIDYLSLIQDMWAKVGVKVTLDSKDLATYTARVRAKNYDNMFYYSTSANWQKMVNLVGTGQYNMSFINDAKVNEAYPIAMDLVGYDDATLAKNFAALLPYILEQAWVIPKPNPYAYVIWWPWVKNWNGELSVGYYNYPSYMKYRWQDTAIKEKMTGSK